MSDEKPVERVSDEQAHAIREVADDPRLVRGARVVALVDDLLDARARVKQAAERMRERCAGYVDDRARNWRSMAGDIRGDGDTAAADAFEEVSEELDVIARDIRALPTEEL